MATGQLDNICLVRSVCHAHIDRMDTLDFLDTEYAPMQAPPLPGPRPPTPAPMVPMHRQVRPRHHLGTMRVLAPPAAAPAVGDLARLERDAKDRLVDILLGFIDAAGPASKIRARMQERYAGEAGAILRTLLGKGACSTIRGHIGR